MNAIHSTLLAVAVLFTIGVNASTLALSIEHHAAAATSGQEKISLRARFTDEPVIADVKLDEHARPQLPSTRENLDELKRPSSKTWFFSR